MNKTIRAILPFLISGFLFSIIISSTAYFNSTFIEKTFPNIKTGVVYTISSILVVLLSLKLPALQSKIGNRKLTLITLSILSLSLFFISFFPNNLNLFFFIMFLASGTITFSVMDIFIEKYSSDEYTGRVRGLYLTSLNLAWIFSPLIGSFLLGNSGNFSFLYKIAFLMSLFVIWSVYSSSKNFVDDKYIHHNLKDFILILKDKTVSKILLLQFILQFFYAWMVIYTPIFLHEVLKFDWPIIGKIFILMLLPFVIIQYPLGKIADKKNDEKDLIKMGFLIMAISTTSLGLYNETNALFIAIILFFSRVGAAIVEVMIESLFFKQIEKNEPTKISIFRMMYPGAYIIAPILAIPILSLGFEILYMILSFFLVGTILILKNLKEKSI